MRVFLTLCSLAAVALAKPQYNYGSGVSGTYGSGSSGGSLGGLGGGFSSFSSGGSGSLGGGGIKFGGGNSGGSSLGFGSGGSSFGSGSLGGGSSFGSGSLGGGGSSFGLGSLGGGSGGSSFGSGSIGGGSFGGASYGQDGGAGFEAPLVHKQFISVAAPEDHDNLERNKHLVIGRPQKNYRVVFIKAPSSSNANVRLSAEYAPKEEKTVIYVLSKKDNSLEVSDIATPAPTVPSKPEVFFIKYKTDAEAQHAQKQIQAEYDRIEGSSEHTDGGVAPQQSVIGILGNGDAGHGSGSGSGFGSSSGFGSGSSFGSSSSSGLGSGSSSFNSGSSGSIVGGGSSSGIISSVSVGGGVKSPAYLPPAAR